MKSLGFKVDTQLFQELGDLLVGKDSTALAELVKNAYDADARNVTITGQNLSTPRHASITISDDGVGMTADQFRSGFLTIAGRSKRGHDKRSPVLGRVLTGEKGVGRLAARKLAERLTIQTRPYDGSPLRSDGLPGAQTSLTATIDWERIEACESLDQLEGAKAVLVEEHRDGSLNPRAGTAITLGPLRRAWSEAQKTRFVSQVVTLRPWSSVVETLPRQFDKLLFDRLFKKPASKQDEFRVVFDGEFHELDLPGRAQIEEATWAVEIDCSVKRGTIRYAFAPARKYWKDKHGVDAHEEKLEMPLRFDSLHDFAFDFRARIVEQHGERWDESIGGIRVYMDGFRVLPYGERGNDWLEIDADYSSRTGATLPRLSALDQMFPAGDSKEFLSMKRNQAYAGAVAISKVDAPNLQILVTREGFVPSEYVDWLISSVRRGVDLMTRTRRAQTAEIQRERKQQSAELKVAAEADVERSPSAQLLHEKMQEVQRAAERYERAQGQHRTETAAAEFAKLTTTVAGVERTLSELGGEHSLLRVLASIGGQLFAVSHEVNALLSLSGTVRRKLEAFADDEELTREQQKKLRETIKLHVDLHHGLERQAAYLVDISGLEARRRRSRQSLRKRFDAAQRVFQMAIDRKSLTIDNELDDEFKSPAMFPAEVVAVFINLLSNAVKFAEEGGRVRVRRVGASNRLVLENTGIAVDFEDSEKWFKPFMSTTVAADASLGQGMGLGLTIVRSILDEYGAEVRFVRPTKNFSTAVEIEFPEP